MNSFRCILVLLSISITLNSFANDSFVPPSQEGSTKIKIASLTPEEREILRNGEIGDNAYFAGGVVGTFFGLGIGQAIQGRYVPTGLMMTVGEVSSFSIAMAGAISCIDLPGCHHDGLVSAGLIAYLGFRVWEIIDVWATPSSINSRYRNLKDHVDETKADFFVAPVAGQGASIDGTRLALQFHF